MCMFLIRGQTQDSKDYSFIKQRLLFRLLDFKLQDIHNIIIKNYTSQNVKSRKVQTNVYTSYSDRYS